MYFWKFLIYINDYLYIEKIYYNLIIGPFWISTTVILTLFVTSCIAKTLVTYLNDEKGDAKYIYDFSLLSFGTVTVYTYIGIVPLVIWFLCKYFAISLGLIDLYCLYGYGLSLWIPAAVNIIIYIFK